LIRYGDLKGLVETEHCFKRLVLTTSDVFGVVKTTSSYLLDRSNTLEVETMVAEVFGTNKEGSTLE
jgi:hypothetical protein